MTRLYVTHCEDYRDPANGWTIGIYSFRDLNTTLWRVPKIVFVDFPSVFALNDLRVGPVCFARHPDTTFLSYFRVIKGIVLTTTGSAGRADRERGSRPVPWDCSVHVHPQVPMQGYRVIQRRNGPNARWEGL
jgi:hypothetical protein